MSRQLVESEDIAVAADKLHSLAIRLLRLVRAADKETPLGPAQLSALSVLAFAGEISLKQLAAAEQVSLPTISRTATALDSAGLIARREDDADRRRSLVSITRTGRRLFDRARARRLAKVRELLSELGTDEWSMAVRLADRLIPEIERRRGR